MNAHAVFRGVTKDFLPALRQWIEGHKSKSTVMGLGDTKPNTTSVRLETDEETLVALLHCVKRDSADGGNIKGFQLAVFALDDDRCEMVNGRLALDDKRLHRALPAMGATPQSLAAARRRARGSAVTAGSSLIGWSAPGEIPE